MMIYLDDLVHHLPLCEVAQDLPTADPTQETRATAVGHCILLGSHAATQATAVYQTIIGNIYYSISSVGIRNLAEAWASAIHLFVSCAPLMSAPLPFIIRPPVCVVLVLLSLSLLLVSAAEHLRQDVRR